MKMAMAALRLGNKILTCERDRDCFDAAVARLRTYYGLLKRQNALSEVDAQVTSLRTISHKYMNFSVLTSSPMKI